MLATVLGQKFNSAWAKISISPSSWASAFEENNFFPSESYDEFRIVSMVRCHQRWSRNFEIPYI